MHGSICSAVAHCSVPALLLGLAHPVALIWNLLFAATTEMKERETWLFQRCPSVESWDEWHKAVQLHGGRGITVADSLREGTTHTEVFQSAFQWHEAAFQLLFRAVRWWHTILVPSAWLLCMSPMSLPGKRLSASLAFWIMALPHTCST